VLAGHVIIKGKMKRKQEQGVYLILVAAMGLVILSLCALAIGYGLVFSTNSRLISIANVSALGALDVYVRSDRPEALRRSAALAKANELLFKNQVPGLDPLNALVLKSDFEDSDQSAGFLSFGRYFSEDPLDSAGRPCRGEGDGEVIGPTGSAPSSFPCFVESGPDEAANAIRIHLRTQAANKLAAPFARALGVSGEFSLATNSTAATVETCGVFLLKASLSSVIDTHKVSQIWNLNMVSGQQHFPFLTPSLAQDVAFHAFMLDGLKKDDGQFRDCFNSSDWVGTAGFIEEIRYWCNLLRPDPRVADLQQPPSPESRSEWIERRGDYIGDHFYFRRFQSDFAKNAPIFIDYLDKEVIVDRYNAPFAEPLSLFLLGFNAGFRALDQRVSAADKTALMAFALDSNGRRWPLDRAPGEGLPIPDPMTNQMGMLVQLTNMENAGVVDSQGNFTTPSLSPNYVTQGFLPVLNSADRNSTASNQSKAIEDAIDLIKNQCPPASRKYIILATDGLATCLTGAHFDSLPECVAPRPGVPGCEDWYCTRTTPSTCEKSVCGNHVNYALFNESYALEELLPKMQEAGIMFSVLFSGQGTRPHMKNVLNEAAECREELSFHDNKLDPENLRDCFLSFSQAAALGKGGMSNPGLGIRCREDSIFDCSSKPVASAAAEDAPTHIEAYNDVVKSTPGAYYGRSLAILGEISARTGGLMCPLTDLSSPANYIQFDPQYSGCPCLLPSETPTPACAAAPPCKLKNALRVPEAAELFSLEYLRKGEQAAKCVLDTIGLNQTLFVHPWKEVFN
jgi:hypothetical protein